MDTKTNFARQTVFDDGVELKANLGLRPDIARTSPPPSARDLKTALPQSDGPTSHERPVHRPNVKRLALKLAVAVLCGITIPLLLIVSDRQSAPTPVASAPAPSFTHVVVGDPVAAEKSGLELPGPSHVVEFAQSQPVPLEQRRYLTADAEPRSYAPDYRSSAQPVQVGSGSPSEPLQLRQIPGTDGRFVSTRNEVAWQGGWSPNDPAGNLARGKEYSKYLDQTIPGTNPGERSLRALGGNRPTHLSNSKLSSQGPVP